MEANTPTKKLYAAVFGRTPEYDVAPEDISEFMAILDTLTESQLAVLKKRLGILDGYEMTYKQIGQLFGVSDASVAGHYRSALRNLRSRSTARHLEMLYTSKASLRAQILELEARCDSLQDKYRGLCESYSLLGLRVGIKLEDLALEPLEPKTEFGFIHELGFSNRTLNALSRKQITKTEELLHYTREDLLRIRTFGKSSLADVEAKLAAVGLKLKD